MNEERKTITSNDRCDVFISYRRDDIKDASVLFSILNRLHYNVFWDQLLRQKRLPNNEYAQVIDQMVAGCKDFILVLSEHTFDPDRIFEPDDWIARELRVAYENRAKIAHFLVYSTDGTRLPKRDKVPDCIRPLLDNVQCDPFDVDIIDISEDPAILDGYLESRSWESDVQILIDPCYNPMTEEEIKRLVQQAQNTEPYDRAVLQEIIDSNPPERTYRVLDIGCARGFVGRTRFIDDRYSMVLGLDHNSECINQAYAYYDSLSDNDREKYNKFIYEECDLSDETDMRRVLRKYHQKFDIIFAAQVLHHLREPVACLRFLRNYLADDGYIVIRTTDDDMKFAGRDDDNKLVQALMKLTYANPNVSADRKSGRKLFGWFHACGIENVHIRTFGRSTEELDKDGRLIAFNESFTWRGKAFKAEDINTPAYAKTQEKLKLLRDRFESGDGFWYCEFEFIGYGTPKAKKNN